MLLLNKITQLTSNKKQKIDGVVATVGDYIILDSDIDKAYLEISSQGGFYKRYYKMSDFREIIRR